MRIIKALFPRRNAISLSRKKREPLPHIFPSRNSAMDEGMIFIVILSIIALAIMLTLGILGIVN